MLLSTIGGGDECEAFEERSDSCLDESRVSPVIFERFRELFALEVATEPATEGDVLTVRCSADAAWLEEYASAMLRGEKPTLSELVRNAERLKSISIKLRVIKKTTAKKLPELKESYHGVKPRNY